MPVIYVVLGIAGFLYYIYSGTYISGFYDIGVPPRQLASSLAAFVVAAGACVTGSLMYLLLSRRFRHFVGTPPSTPATTYLTPLRRPGRKQTGYSLLVLSLPFLLIVVGKGPSSILVRPEYLVESHHYVLIVGDLLAMPAILGLGFLTASASRWRWQVTFVSLFLAYWLLFVSLSTRIAAVIVVFFLLGLALGRARERTLVLLLVLWVATLPILFEVPLALRGMAQQGLVPLPTNLARMAAVNSALEYSQSVGELVMNVGFGVPLAAYVSHAQPIPKSVLLTSLSPLPSFISVPGLPPWDAVQEHLRVSPYIPYNALGELLNQGWPWLIAYYLLIGVIAAWTDLGARVFDGQRKRWGYLIASGLLFFFAISSTEYNLRSSTRLVYYAVAAIVLWRVLYQVRFTTPSHRHRVR
ncbi:MAG: hypothetical protein ACREN3_04020 [Gemmatimonadaceae bacterium]